MEQGEELAYYFKRIHLMFERDLNQMMRRFDLTAGQARVMIFLAETARRELCQRDIERHFGLSNPTVTGLLRRMEHKGIIEARPDPEDRRYKRLFLTEKGGEMAEMVGEHIRENDRKLVQGMSPEEEDALRRLLCRVMENMQGWTGPETNRTGCGEERKGERRD